MKKVQALLLILGLSKISPAAIIIVDCSGGGNFTEIQPALDAALDGDTIIVKPCEYILTEPLDFNRLHDPADPESPPVKNITLKSEAGPELTVLRIAEDPADPDRASVLIFENGETTDSILEGFTVTGGKGTARGVLPRGFHGGGILCINRSSPTLRDCWIKDNHLRSGSGGGGVYCEGSSPIITGCMISGNLSGGGGGLCFVGFHDGTRVIESNANVTNCTIQKTGIITVVASIANILHPSSTAA